MLSSFQPSDGDGKSSYYNGEVIQRLPIVQSLHNPYYKCALCKYIHFDSMVMIHKTNVCEET
jgi:hypothetical protein